MKREIRVFALIIVLLMSSLLAIDGFAQRNNYRAWPDTLETIMIEGTVLFDTTHQNIYFLDVDGDSIADYNLAFGPEWYVPESGAVRPENGDYVTIYGSLNERPVLPLVIVFEINGLLWREPVENWWTHQQWCDSLEVVILTGTVLVDTTYYYTKYYLDVDDDQSPDYFLHFGPPWYEPESGATRPEAGETVTIEAGIKIGTSWVHLFVFKLNDLVWRDPSGPAPWTGAWVGKNSQHHKRIHCPDDSGSWVEFPPGAMKDGGPHGNQFQDSLFCEMGRVYPDSLPGQPDSVCAGWHFHFSNPDGKQMFGKGDSAKFMKRLRINLRIQDSDSCGNLLAKLNSTDLTLKFWDENTAQWIELESAAYDEDGQSISLEVETVATYYAVFRTESATTGIAGIDDNLPVVFEMGQNYPNPFNPTTTIAFQLNTTAQIRLTIFNMLGQEVRTLVNELKPAGTYAAIWDGMDNNGNMLPTGFYVYKLDAGNQSQIKRMLLMK
ncbi:T9SS type A sorting domain-containing protein [candidate division KSB1 bacterium]|nr:T9SS type A sorting domain-containing protein [candidate division KSB1 bacterium]